jgi:hypothetical protein
MRFATGMSSHDEHRLITLAGAPRPLIAYADHQEDRCNIKRSADRHPSFRHRSGSHALWRAGGPGARRGRIAPSLRCFAEAGGNFIDTAGVYNAGASERTLADFVARDRDHFVLASKYGMAGEGQDLVCAGGSRKALATSVENSLHRLATDRLDIL